MCLVVKDCTAKYLLCDQKGEFDLACAVSIPTEMCKGFATQLHKLPDLTDHDTHPGRRGGYDQA